MLKHIPNTLTIIRFFLIPFIVLHIFTGNYILAFVLFTLSGITDIADGLIARKFNLITNFGKLMDPLADKLLVSAALICLSESKIPVWIVIIIISRELFISGFRTLAADKGVVLAAGWWGKFKTTFQMIMIIVLIIDLPYTFMGVIGTALIYISLALTIISMVDYVYKNVDVLKG